jgi:hypothetical protein
MNPFVHADGWWYGSFHHDDKCNCSSLLVTADRQVVDGLRVFSPASGLIDCSIIIDSHNSTDVRAVLLMIRDASGLLARLLAGGHTIIVRRLAGAFCNIGRDRIADDITILTVARV